MIRNNGRSYKKENSTRKNNKQMMEKRRRARINTCLTELKSLVLKGMKKEEAEFSKLEKADILELAVNYLNSRKNEQKNTKSCDDENVARYRAGFNECAKEAFKYIGTSTHVTSETRLGVMDHLAGYLQTKRDVGLPAESKKKMAKLHPANVQIKHQMFSPPFNSKPSPVYSTSILRPILPCPQAERVSPRAEDKSTSGYCNTQTTILKDVQNPAKGNKVYSTNMNMAYIKDESTTDIDNESVQKSTESTPEKMWRPW